MGKIDTRHAFRICPVRAEDYELLGTYWEGFYFIELRLPFGLRTAVFIFNSFADALHWILQNKHLIKHLLHYLDDFLTAGEANSPQCEANMQLIKKVFDQLGVPLALDKFIGPTTCLIYLGIEIDTVKQEIRLPKDKFDDLMSILTSWTHTRKVTKHKLLSLIGKLSFAAKVVRPGRIFLRRLIDLSKTAKKLHHHITLNAEAKADINWWLELLPHWNGSGIFPNPNWVNAESMQLFTDASATLGYGCFFRNKWFYGPWPEKFMGRSIEWKEMFRIYAACYLRGHLWQGNRIIFNTDNETNVKIWSKQSTKCPELMDIVRRLFLISAHAQFQVKFVHTPGKLNPTADALSRLQVEKFRKLAPNAEDTPAPLPQDIWLHL